MRIKITHSPRRIYPFRSSRENNENVDKLSEFLVKLTQLSFENIKEFQEYADDKYITDDVDLKQVVFEVCIMPTL